MTTFQRRESPLSLHGIPENLCLLPIRLEGREELNGSYEFTIDLVAPAGAPVDAGKLLGCPVTARIQLPGKALRHAGGLVWSVSMGDSDEALDRYRLTLRPAMATLGLTRRSRVFQDMGALDIIREVLRPAGGAEIDVAHPPPARVMCVQYRETDLEFVLRLCSEEGISHHWRHAARDEGGTVLVLTDGTPRALATGKVAYDSRVGGSARETRVWSWNLVQTMESVSGIVSDDHFQLFGQRLEAGAQPPESIKAGRLDIKAPPVAGSWRADPLSAARQFDAIGPAGSLDPQFASRIDEAQRRRARVAAQGLAASLARARAVGDCCEVTPGHWFRLEGHPVQEGEWLAVAVEMKVAVKGSYWAGESASLECEARVEAAPRDLPQPPWPPRPRPVVGGIETAVVTGPEGAEMHLDMYGRTRVRFRFDTRDAPDSCWVRVAQVWAGNSWGAAFWPRVGHEVVVAFEGGDPDRPVITGSVYNSVNMPPFELPENAYVAGFKSLTQGGDPAVNYHLVLMGDAKGEEAVLIHSENTLLCQQESRQVNRRPSLDATINHP